MKKIIPLLFAILWMMFQGGTSMPRAFACQICPANEGMAFPEQLDCPLIGDLSVDYSDGADSLFVVHFSLDAVDAGSITSYEWSFGDGTGSNELSPVHHYPGEGSYAWAVTVKSGAAVCIRSGTAIITSDRHFTGWQPLASGTTNYLRDIHFTSFTEGWAAGDGATLLHTTSGGCAWSKVILKIAKTESLNTVRFINKNAGWIGSTHYAINTSDGGVEWNCLFRIDNPYGTSMDAQNSLSPVSASTAWGVGHSSEQPGAAVLNRYACPGTKSSWAMNPPDSNLLGISFVDVDNGWAVGTGNIIMRITGASGNDVGFTYQTIGTTLSAVKMLKDTNGFFGWAVGSGGAIYHTDDGRTWQMQSSGVRGDLHGLCFLSRSVGWVVGDAGVILSTVNGGQSWTVESGGTTQNLSGVYFLNAGLGFVVGANGTILKKSSIPAKPVIANIISKTSKPGSHAVISGCGFGATISQNRVYFRTLIATILKAGTGSLSVQIPTTMKKGTVGVYVIVKGQKSNLYKFAIKE